LTLYIQNIKPEGVNPPHQPTLYFPPNQQLKQKYSSWGSWQDFGSAAACPERSRRSRLLSSGRPRPVPRVTGRLRRFWARPTQKHKRRRPEGQRRNFNSIYLLYHTA